MEHLASILWLLTWPVLVFFTYKLAQFGLKALDKHLKESQNDK